MNKDDLPFAKRYGFEPIEIPFQLDSMNEALRIDLWNAFYLHIHSRLESVQYGKETFRRLYKLSWLYFFRLPLDDFTNSDYELGRLVRKHIEHGIWYKVYEFFEFIFSSIDIRSEEYSLTDIVEYVDRILTVNHSAYRIVNYRFIPITNDLEISEIKTVRRQSQTYELGGIQEHLKSSLELISMKPVPDLRNSIKESISMVEVISRIIEPSENTLGKALNKLEKGGKINPTFKSAFEKLYAYSNGKGGIRHALMDEENLTLEEAKFFLVSCSAFTNYLIERANKEKLLFKAQV